MRLFALASTASVVVLSTVSTTFVLLALRSPRWSSQKYYFALNGQSDGTDRLSAVCQATRSPLYRCGLPLVDRNGSCTIPDCRWYKPYGDQSTSCRSRAEMGIRGDDLAGAQGLFGSAQECQQVHYAGNVQIAASAFLALALVLSLELSALTVLRGAPGPASEPGPVATHDSEAKNAPEVSNSRVQAARVRRCGAAASYVALALLFCLYMGAALQVLAQFFGVLAFTINPTPNGADATAGQHKRHFNHFSADEWVMDKALTTYATIAWTAAVLAALAATAVFERPCLHSLPIQLH